MVQRTRIGKLDFNDIKDSIKNHLSQQTEFLDYNFEGSGISQLINVLAYNAHYDALTANFLANEMFLDTATKRSSVVSRAKELGYVPRSRRAPKTTLTVTLKGITNENVVESVILPIGTRFSASVDDSTYTFTTITPHVLNKQIELGSIIYRGLVDVYEGMVIQNTVTYNSVDNTITIPNVDIDTSTLKVELFIKGEWVEFSQPHNFLTVGSSSTVYMLQEGFEGYEIYFGDGVLGVKPEHNTQVRMTYIVTSGPGANGAKSFSLVSNVSGMHSGTVVTVTASAQASGGEFEESLESIRLNAKNTFGSQNRAVTSYDYAALAMQNFSAVKDVLAWDGSDNVPPKFGKVVLCVQPAVGDVLSVSNKAAIADFLQRKGVGNVKVDFVDPEYINLEVQTKVKYNLASLTVSTYELEYMVKAAITEYAATAIQKFRGIIRYSSLVADIDRANYAIVGNETTLSLAKYLPVDLFGTNNFNFSFANPIKKGTLVSSKFFDGLTSNKLYLKDSNGALHIYYSSNGKDVLYKANIGRVDYVAGTVVISNLDIATIEGLKFKLSTVPENLDISSSKNIILTLSQEDINVITVKDNA